MSILVGGTIYASDFTSTSTTGELSILKLIQNAIVTAKSRLGASIIDNITLDTSSDNLIAIKKLIRGNTQEEIDTLQPTQLANLNRLIAKYNELVDLSNTITNKSDFKVPYVKTGEIIRASNWIKMRTVLTGGIVDINGTPVTVEPMNFGVPVGGIFIVGPDDVKVATSTYLKLNKQVDQTTVTSVTSSSTNPITWSLDVSNISIDDLQYIGSISPEISTSPVYKSVTEVPSNKTVFIKATWKDPATNTNLLALHDIIVKNTNIVDYYVEEVTRYHGYHTSAALQSSTYMFQLFAFVKVKSSLTGVFTVTSDYSLRLDKATGIVYVEFATPVYGCEVGFGSGVNTFSKSFYGTSFPMSKIIISTKTSDTTSYIENTTCTTSFVGSSIIISFFNAVTGASISYYSCSVDIYYEQPSLSMLENTNSLYYICWTKPQTTSDPAYIYSFTGSPTFTRISGTFEGYNVEFVYNYPGYEGQCVLKVSSLTVKNCEYGSFNVKLPTIKIYNSTTGITSSVYPETTAVDVYNTSQIQAIAITPAPPTSTPPIGSVYSKKGTYIGIYEDLPVVQYSVDINLLDGTSYTKQAANNITWSITPSSQTIDQTGRFTPSLVDMDTTVVITAVCTDIVTGTQYSQQIQFRVFNRADVEYMFFKDAIYPDDNTKWVYSYPDDTFKVNAISYTESQLLTNVPAFNVLENTTSQFQAFIHYDDNTEGVVTTSNEATWGFSNTQGLIGLSVTATGTTAGKITTPAISNDTTVVPNISVGSDFLFRFPVKIRNILGVQIVDSSGNEQLYLDENSNKQLKVEALLSNNETWDLTNDPLCTFAMVTAAGSPTTYDFMSFGVKGEIITRPTTIDQVGYVKYTYKTYSEIKEVKVFQTNTIQLLEILGLSATIDERGTYQLGAKVTYNDGTTLVFGESNKSMFQWSVSNTTISAISEFGVLTTNELTLDTSLIVTVKFTSLKYGIQTKTQTTTVKDLRVLTDIEVRGQDSMTENDGGSYKYECWGVYSRSGTTEYVKLLQNIAWSMQDKAGTTTYISSDGYLYPVGIINNNTVVKIKALYTGDGYNVSALKSVTISLGYWYTYNPSAFNINDKTVICTQSYSSGNEIAFKYPIPLASPRYFEFKFNSPDVYGIKSLETSESIGSALYSNSLYLYLDPAWGYSVPSLESISYNGIIYYKSNNMSNNSIANYAHRTYYKSSSFKSNVTNSVIGIAVYSNYAWLSIDGDWGIVGNTTSYPIPTYVASGVPNINNLQYAASSHFIKYFVFSMMLNCSITLNPNGPFLHKPAGFLAWSS